MARGNPAVKVALKGLHLVELHARPALFFPRELAPFIKHPPRRAEGKSTVGNARESHEAHAVERPTALCRGRANIESELLVHQLIGHLEINATSAAQAKHVPIAEEFHA